KVCIMQLMEEALNIPWQKKGFEKAAVTEIMNHMPGWEHFSNPRHFGIKYGRQKGYARVTTDSDNHAPEKDFVQIEMFENPFETQ
ncbi:MAG: virulence-associated protein E, partial [Lachnospiraceae bacterium]|nr:virulence-associated protein E [Lachnospiraceae bacterium]